MVTATGWSSLASDGLWVPSGFTLAPDMLGLSREGEAEPRWMRLTEIVGLDQLGVDPEGSPILEFALADGSVVLARLPASFVDETVAMLQRSRVPGDATSGSGPSDAPASAAPPEPADIGDPPPPAGRAGSKAVLAKEVQELRDYLDRIGLAERRALRADIDSLIAHRTEVLAESRAATVTRRQEEARLVRVRRETVLQDVGVYQPRHPAEDAPALAARLAEVRLRIADIASTGRAVDATDDWQVNGSRTEGRKVVEDLAKLLLHTYNAEADLLVQTMRPYELDAATERLNVTRTTIERLGISMRVQIRDEYHRLRLDELTLAADSLAATAAGERLVAESTEPGAGFVYVVSNPGSFGVDVVRLGTTTSSDPARLVSELDGGRLPFPSDVHALVPSEDADDLLQQLRASFDHERVNLADPACAYFAVAPTEVRDRLLSLGVDVPSFTATATADEWHQTRNSREHEG